MKHRQTRVLDALRGTQGFLDANTTLLAVINVSGARRTLDDAVTQLSTQAVNQDVGTRLSRGETANQQSLRHVLRFNHMKPIADVARMYLREVPNFIALKRPRNNVSATRLIAAAAGMADAAAPFAQVFVDAGLAADFLEQLRQAADDMRLSLDDRAQHVRKRVGATEGLKAAEKRGTGILRLLDGLVIPKLGTNDPLIVQWKAARKIHAKPGPVMGREAVAPAAGSDAGPAAAMAADATTAAPHTELPLAASIRPAVRLTNPTHQPFGASNAWKGGWRRSLAQYAAYFAKIARKRAWVRIGSQLGSNRKA